MSVKTVLGELASLEGVQVVLLASRDGLIISSSQDNGERDELQAALTAAIFGTIGRAILPLQLGMPTDAIVETTTHCLQITSLDELLLISLAEKSSNVGLVRLQMRQVIRRLQSLLAGNIEGQEAIMPMEAVPSATHSPAW